jgi:hypothetical protein
VVLGQVLMYLSAMSDRSDDPLEEPVRPVVRRRRQQERKQKQQRGRGPNRPAGSSLRPELLSGRSLAPPPKSRGERFREHRGKIAVGLAVLLVLLAVLAGKLLAESAADSEAEQRAEELRELLGDATPEDFLAFSAGVRQEGSLARRIRDTDGFQNVQANAERAFIRIQPSGWWAGFTERCLVVVVHGDGVTVTVPKTNCVRVPVPDGSEPD